MADCHMTDKPETKDHHINYSHPLWEILGKKRKSLNKTSERKRKRRGGGSSPADGFSG